MNMYIHELKTAKKSTIIWTITLVSLLVLYMSFYSAITNDADAFMKIVEGVSPIVRQALGMAVNQITSPLGYYSFVFSFVVVIGAIQGINMGLNIISKEIRDKTADFLLTKPRTRVSVISAKLLAGLTCILITGVIYIILSALVIPLFTSDSFNMNALILISSSLLITQLIFYALGLLIAVVFPKIKSVIAVSLPIVFGFYFLSIIASITADQFFKYLSIFKYFDPTYIIVNSSYETKYVMLSAAIIVVCITLSYIIYNKKDVHAV